MLIAWFDGFSSKREEKFLEIISAVESLKPILPYGVYLTWIPLVIYISFTTSLD